VTRSAATVLEEMLRERNDNRGTGSKVTGRPPALSPADEFELYLYRKQGAASLKTIASMWRVSVPTAKRIIAKFRRYDARLEQSAREFRATAEAVKTEAVDVIR
jgi:transposase InsO family protein